MTKKEQELINACRNLPKSVYGNYHYGEELVEVVGKVMGYRIIHFSRGRCTISNEDFDKFLAIKKGMREKGIISWSKSGSMWKLN